MERLSKKQIELLEKMRSYQDFYENDKDGFFYRTIRDISNDTGISVNTVMKYLRQLEEQGFIVSKKGNSKVSNRYKINSETKKTETQTNSETRKSKTETQTNSETRKSKTETKTTTVGVKKSKIATEYNILYNINNISSNTSNILESSVDTSTGTKKEKNKIKKESCIKSETNLPTLVKTQIAIAQSAVTPTRTTTTVEEQEKDFKKKSTVSQYDKFVKKAIKADEDREEKLAIQSVDATKDTKETVIAKSLRDEYLKKLETVDNLQDLNDKFINFQRWLNTKINRGLLSSSDKTLLRFKVQESQQRIAYSIVDTIISELEKASSIEEAMKINSEHLPLLKELSCLKDLTNTNPSNRTWNDEDNPYLQRYANGLADVLDRIDGKEVRVETCKDKLQQLYELEEKREEEKKEKREKEPFNFAEEDTDFLDFL